MSPSPDQTMLEEETDAAPLSTLALRGALGGVLMGLANLVPGISGGTMLLAAGVYPAFINAIAKVSTLRFTTRSIITLVAIVGSAALGILLLAGVMKALVIEHRWMMYSLFIGLTLGGVPLVYRLARPLTPAVYAGAAAAFLLMVWMAASGGVDTTGAGSSFWLLLLSGLAAASAMILPGVSGGYLLLLLGQYESILGAIDQVKEGLLGSGGAESLMGALGVVVPLGIGVVVGVVGVSNLLRWLLRHHKKSTLGALLGLLLGAVVGLWPFQEPVPPAAIHSPEPAAVTALEAASTDPEDWELATFTPSGGQIVGCLLLIAVGFAVTVLIARVGRAAPGSDETDP